MSILLNALKKSEQQRQLGATPTLSTPVESHLPDNQSERRWLPLSMMALSAIVMAWIGWNQYRPPFSVVSAITQAQDDTVTPVTGQTDTPESTGAEDSREPALSSAARTPVESFQAGEPTSEDAVVTVDSTPADPDRRQQLNQSFRSFRPETPPAEAAPPEQAADPAAPIQSNQGATDLAENGRTRQVEAPQASIDPQVLEPISYWEVPQSVRENMPEFKISVLVYAENPEDRFLLMNGQRLAEKDDLTGGVRLDEIRRDGAVFTYRKYRFLVKG
jgi:general secretion pathway protein B